MLKAKAIEDAKVIKYKDDHLPQVLATVMHAIHANEVL